MGKANAQIEITASSGRLMAGLSAAASKFKAFSGGIARGMGAAFKGINSKLAPGDTMKKAMGTFGGDLMGRGMDAVIDAAQGVRDFERNLIRYQIASSGSDASTAALRGQIRGISKDTAIAADEILAGASSYVALTGDASGAKDAMSAFARVAQASGSKVADVATASAALKQSMQIDGSQFEAAFSGLIVQGKAGAVEIKDFAGELATLSPQFATFGHKGLGGLREMGAAFQVIRQGAGSSGEAATQFQAAMGELVSSHKELAKIGIQVFAKNPKTGKKELRDFISIADDLAKNKALGDPAKLAKIFGRKESQSAIRTIRDQIGTMHELARAGEDTSAVQRDLTTYLESDAGRLDRTFNTLKNTIAEVFTPERITAFVNAVEQLADKLGPVIDGVGKIGDALGGLYGAGQAVRGFFEGEANPYAEDEFKAQMRSGDMSFLAGEKTPESIAKDQKGLKQAAAFRQTRDSIIGAEVNERTSPESIKRAALASFRNARSGASDEDNAAAEAGVMYLRAAKVPVAKQNEIYGKELLKAIQTMAPNITSALVDALKNPPTVQIGDNQVARSVARSTDTRRRPPR